MRTVRMALAVGACLLSVGPTCRAEGKKLTVKTSPGSPRVVVKPGQSSVVVLALDFSITNNYTQPVTAFVIWADDSQGVPPAEDAITTNAYFDSVIHEKDQPILPGQTRTEKSYDSSAQFRAAVFADGSSFGDPAWVERVFHHRQLFLQLTDRATGCVEAFLLPAPKRVELLQKLSPCPWDFKAPGLDVEGQNMFYPLSKEVMQGLGPMQKEVKGPAIGDPHFGMWPLARFTEEAQKLRSLRARVADSISRHEQQGVK